MAHAALIATQMTDRTSRAKTLSMGGVNIDLNKQGVTSGGVPIETVSVSELGPGGVSSMRFSIEDLASAYTIAAGAEIQFWNVTLVRPIFAGYVSSYAYRPHESQIGRWVDVNAVGVEALLDWLIVPSLVVPAGTTVQAAIQSCCANTEGVNPLRAFGGPSGGGNSQALPTDPLNYGHGSTQAVVQYAVTITAQTLREAIRMVSDAGSVDINFGGIVGQGYQSATPTKVSVDFTFGLLAKSADVQVAIRSDYVSLTLNDTPAGAKATAGLSLEVDATSVVRGVYVVGANAAGTGVVMDGTGLPGRVAYINDSTIDTAQKLTTAASAYIAAQAQSGRGTFGMTVYTPVADVYTGVNVTINDANLPALIPTLFAQLMQIDKTFNDGLTEEWTVGVGGLAPSLARYTRRVTRTIRS